MNKLIAVLIFIPIIAGCSVKTYPETKCSDFQLNEVAKNIAWCFRAHNSEHLCSAKAKFKKCDLINNG